MSQLTLYPVVYREEALQSAAPEIFWKVWISWWSWCFNSSFAQEAVAFWASQHTFTDAHFDTSHRHQICICYRPEEPCGGLLIARQIARAFFSWLALVAAGFPEKFIILESARSRRGHGEGARAAGGGRHERSMVARLLLLHRLCVCVDVRARARVCVMERTRGPFKSRHVLSNKKREPTNGCNMRGHHSFPQARLL